MGKTVGSASRRESSHMGETVDSTCVGGSRKDAHLYPPRHRGYFPGICFAGDFPNLCFSSAPMSPWKPKTPCRTPGCKELTHAAHCARHAPAAHEPQARRASPSQRGYGRAHQRWRRHILALHPLCQDCLAENPPRTTAASEANHQDGDNPNLAEEK